MAMVARAACVRGLCGEDVRDAISDRLTHYGLPTVCPYSADMLLGALCADKKIFGSTLHLIVPAEIGLCRILPVPVAELPGWLHDGGGLNTTIAPGPRTGSIRVPASKSQAHRLLICAALGTHPVRLRLTVRPGDIDATASCLRALGAEIEVQDDALTVCPIRDVPQAPCHLFCGESGSTLRFLLPVCGALGAQAVFHMEGRLPERPLAPLDRQLLAHGMTLRQEGALLYAGGRLTGGAFSLPGSVSSQLVSGLLMALPRVEGESLLTLTDALQSAGYVDMTLDALRLSGFWLKSTGASRIPGGRESFPPEACAVEGRLAKRGVLSLRRCFFRAWHPRMRAARRLVSG